MGKAERWARFQIVSQLSPACALLKLAVERYGHRIRERPIRLT